MNAILKQTGLPRSRCFQIEYTSSKLEENVGTSQIVEVSIVNWAIITRNFSILLAHLAMDCKQKIIC